MDLDKAIDGYKSVRERLQGAWQSPSQLSDLGVKMATYGTYIGDHLADAEATYELNKSKTYLDSLKGGNSATKAENESRAINAEVRAEAIRLKIIHKDLYSLVSVIQSRLRILENEQRSNV